jgi:dolichol-phosphate mannosyltransferase
LIAFPAFNEAAAIGPLLREALAALPAGGGVLVVDDGSGDQTAALAAEIAGTQPVQLVRHGVNRGLAAAVRTIIEQAVVLLTPDGSLVILDADGSHSPAQIAALREKAATGCDVVIASRYAAGGEIRGVPAHRRFFTTFSKLIYRAMLGPPPARDLSCGYRLYRAELLRRAVAAFGDNLIVETGFGVMVELLTKLAWLGARVGEIPLVLRYDLKQSPSRMRLGRTIREFIFLLWRLRAERGRLRPPKAA